MVLSLFIYFASFAFGAEPSVRDYPNAIEALRTTPEFHSFAAEDGTQLVYAVVDAKTAGPRRGPLAVITGKGESSYRYLEFAREMQQKGWGPIYILDPRGQGFSEKAVKDSIHVENFDAYVNDFIKFMDGPVKTDLAKRGILVKPNIVAHSMGGAIANLSLRQRPDLTDRIAYIAPMFDIHLKDALDRMQNKPVTFLANTLRSVGLGNIRIGGSVDSAPPALLSTDLERIFTSYRIEREMGIRTPKATISWVSEAFRAGDRIRVPGTQPATPSAIFQGTYDKVISNAALVNYACTTPHCTLVEFSGAHALHQEREPIRRLLVEQMDTFFRARQIQDAGLDCQKFYRVITRGLQPN